MKRRILIKMIEQAGFRKNTADATTAMSEAKIQSSYRGTQTSTKSLQKASSKSGGLNEPRPLRGRFTSLSQKRRRL